MKKVLLYLLLIFTPWILQSQNIKGIDTIIFKQTGSFNVTISDASMIVDYPVIVDTSTIKKNMQYGIYSQKFPTLFLPEQIKSPKMVGEKLPRLYKGYAKAGFGNYTTPYGEVYYNNTRSKTKSYGIHAKHISSKATLKDKGYSGFSHNNVDLFGKTLIQKHAVIGSVGYNRDVYHCYAYNIQTADLDKVFTTNYFSNPVLQLNVNSYYSDSSAIHHQVKFKYSNLSDNQLSAENYLTLFGNIFTYYQGHKLFLDVMTDYNSYKQEFDTINNTLLSFKPGASYAGNKLKASVAMGIWSESGEKNNFYFYPEFNISYDVASNIFVPYAGVTGGRIRNNYHSLSCENPYISPPSELNNTEKKYELFAGMSGSLSAKINYNAVVKYSKLNNFYSYILNKNEVLENRFITVWDSIRCFNFHGEAIYRNKEKLNIIVSGDYFRFDVQHELRAWHMPGFKFSAIASYNLKDKILIKSEIYTIGKRNITTSIKRDNILELKGYTDINLLFEYRINEKFSGFLNLYNLGAFRYQIWQNYTAQRFHLLAGAGYSF